LLIEKKKLGSIRGNAAIFIMQNAGSAYKELEKLTYCQAISFAANPNL
jgi:hypothetical protein